MKRLLVPFLLLVSTLLFPYEITVFSDVRHDEMTSETKKYLYCLIDLEDVQLSSSNLFMSGKNVFQNLVVFEGEGRLFSIAELFEGMLISGEEYTLYVNLETPDGVISQKKTLLALNGLLMPYNPLPIPFEEIHMKTHYVLSGEYLYKIARDYGISRADLEILNPDEALELHAGDRLKIGEIQFKESPYEIYVSLSACKLDLYYMGELLISFPVAVGRDDSTKSGIYRIKRMVEDPALYWEGEYIKPLSPINGLGKWWLELSDPQYGIHGTNKPWEIGKRISHGCIRMQNNDVAFLQRLVPIGTKVIIK